MIGWIKLRGSEDEAILVLRASHGNPCCPDPQKLHQPSFWQAKFQHDYSHVAADLFLDLVELIFWNAETLQKRMQLID